jgi:hypothetical protein
VGVELNVRDLASIRSAVAETVARLGGEDIAPPAAACDRCPVNSAICEVLSVQGGQLVTAHPALNSV